jgi:hypothetical protein
MLTPGHPCYQRSGDGPFCCQADHGGTALVDGLVLHGRLVKVTYPEAYTSKVDGTTKMSYPSVVVLAGDSTLKVEYRTAEAMEDALLEGCKEADKLPKGGGLTTGLPVVELVVHGLGAWDPASKSFGAVRLAGGLS